MNFIVDSLFFFVVFACVVFAVLNVVVVVVVVVVVAATALGWGWQLGLDDGAIQHALVFLMPLKTKVFDLADAGASEEAEVEWP